MITNKKLRRYALYCLGGIAGFLIIITSILFLFKNDIARFVFNKANERFIQQFKTELTVESIVVHGISEIELKNFIIKPQQADTLFAAKEIHASIRLWPLLRGRLRPDKVAINQARIQLIRKNGEDNFSIFFKTKSTQAKTITETNYALLADKILDAVFGKIPRDLNIEELNIICQLDKDIVQASIPYIKINKHVIDASISLSEQHRRSNFKASGNIDEGKRYFDVSISKTDKARIQLPFLESILGAKAGFNQIKVSFSQDEQSSNQLKATGKVLIRDAYIDQAKIAPEEIDFEELELDYHLTIEKNALALDSTSEVSLNHFKTSLYARFEKDTSRKVQFGLYAPWFKAQDFFNALPKGLFTTLKGIQTQGKLNYRLKLDVDIDYPDSILFISDIKQDHFKIISFGEADLTKINSDFILPVYDDNRLVRSINVSPQNPHYVPYNEIPQNVIYAVLTSEDGGFMHHRGFNEEAFKKSITANIKAKRFKRGGSTISMQLVKNVYLNKNKTISRKVEEVILVWLIENLRLSSKERMLEVYFNIIEWGPGVYGIGEASTFYFNKKPNQIQWNEAIYLASIVPSPKKFARKFDEQGNLKQMDGYYRLLSGIMVRRGQMPESVKDSLIANVKLNGIAQEFLKTPKDSIQKLSAETNLNEEDELDLLDVK